MCVCAADLGSEISRVVSDYQFALVDCNTVAAPIDDAIEQVSDDTLYR